MPTKCDLNQKRKLKYKIGIGLDRKWNSALKRRKIRYDILTLTFHQVPFDKHQQQGGGKLVSEIVEILENFVPVFDDVSV